MSFSSAALWWEEWQLRILVLGSLFTQYLLFFSAPFRKYAIPSWSRYIIWLSYLGSDALAIYALATLFNRQRLHDYGSANTNSILEVVWAPVLLMHLGGQDPINAYNIEDNELWPRQIFTAVFQITVAIYVFCRSWPVIGGDKRLLQASILLLTSGILRCMEKPVALKRSSVNSLVSNSDPALRMASMIDDTISPEEYVKEARVFAQPNHYCQAQGEGDTVDIEHKYVRQAQGEANTEDLEANPDDPKHNHAPKPNEKAFSGHQAANLGWKGWEQGNLEDIKLFADLASSYHDRLHILESFWALDDDGKAYVSLQKELFSTFDLLYTRKKMNISMDKIRKGGHAYLKFFHVFMGTTPLLLPLVAIGFFHKSHREAYSVNDVIVTYALFCCTAALEIFSIFFHMFVPSHVLTSSGMVSQYSLVSFFVSKERRSKMLFILSSVLNWENLLQDFLDRWWCMKSCSSSSTITKLVIRHVKVWWKEHIVDAASYRNDHRGQWTIQHEGCSQDQKWGLDRPFDESVLVWHIATGLCFYQKNDMSASHGNSTECREISNYMIYLLFLKPEMLLSGARRNLFKTANDELEELLKDDKPFLKAMLKGNKPFIKFFKGKGPSPEDIERGLMQRIITKLQQQQHIECRDEEQYPDTKGFIHEAWKLSKVLFALGDQKMWDVIEGVWVEMLCFSASRSRGYLHAKSLSTGGELLTYVWLLLSHMGMETLPERLQRVGLSSVEGNSGGAAPSTSQIPGIEDPPPFRRSRPHHDAAAGPSTSGPRETQ